MSVYGSGIGFYARDNNHGCGSQMAVFCQKFRKEDFLQTNHSQTLEEGVQKKVEERFKTLTKENDESEVRNLAMFVQDKYSGY